MLRLMNSRLIWIIYSSLFFFSCTSVENDGKVIIAVSSSSRNVVEAIFDNNKNVEIISGSTGHLVTQLLNGAPYDIFLSADSSYAHYAALTIGENQPLYFSSNQLYLWKSSEDMPEFQQNVAFANPKHAPFGKLAQLHLLQKKDTNTLTQIVGQSISQVNQYIHTKSVDQAYTSKSSFVDFMNNGELSGDWKALPFYCDQYILKINTSKKVDEALHELYSQEALELLVQNGFSINREWN